ncbi:hypothetical protein JW930_04170 [Candidatus Woesearchaeota archaeon]|nr:hypothetical protein [Candidatus Woesearchaeota archaeon]
MANKKRKPAIHKKSKKNQNDKKKDDQKVSAFAIVLATIGILLITAGVISAYYKLTSGEKVEVTTTTTIGAEPEGSSESSAEEPLISAAEPEPELEEHEVYALEKKLSDGYTMAVTELNLEIDRGESEVIGAAFKNSIGKLRYFNAKVYFVLLDYEGDGGISRASLIMDDWVNPDSQFFQMQPGEQKLFPIVFSVPSYAEKGTYHFYFQVCYFDPDYKLKDQIDPGCDSEQNRKLGQEQRIRLVVE